MRCSTFFAVVAASLLAAPVPAGAQADVFSERPPSGRGSVAVHLQVTEPRGDFGRNTDNGFGVGGYILNAPDQNKILNLRGDFSFVSYVNDRRRIPLVGTGGLIRLDLRTSSNIASLVAGPQLLGPTGRFTPYATALGGFSVFWTESTVEGSQQSNTPFASTTNASDAVWAYGGAVGAYLRISGGRTPARVDIGARFLRHDDVRYLTADRITQAYNTNTTPVPVRGRADFITYYAGLNVIAF